MGDYSARGQNASTDRPNIAILPPLSKFYYGPSQGWTSAEASPNHNDATWSPNIFQEAMSTQVSRFSPIASTSSSTMWQHVASENPINISASASHDSSLARLGPDDFGGSRNSSATNRAPIHTGWDSRPASPDMEGDWHIAETAVERHTASAAVQDARLISVSRTKSPRSEPSADTVWHQNFPYSKYSSQRPSARGSATTIDVPLVLQTSSLDVESMPSLSPNVILRSNIRDGHPSPQSKRSSSNAPQSPVSNHVSHAQRSGNAQDRNAKPMSSNVAAQTTSRSLQHSSHSSTSETEAERINRDRRPPGSSQPSYTINQASRDSKIPDNGYKQEHDLHQQRTSINTLGFPPTHTSPSTEASSMIEDLHSVLGVTSQSSKSVALPVHQEDVRSHVDHLDAAKNDPPSNLVQQSPINNVHSVLPGSRTMHNRTLPLAAHPSGPIRNANESTDNDEKHSNSSFYWHSGQSSPASVGQTCQVVDVATPTAIVTPAHLTVTDIHQGMPLPIRSTSLATDISHGASALGYGGPSDWEYFGDYEAEEVDDEALYSQKPKAELASDELTGALVFDTHHYDALELRSHDSHSCGLIRPDLISSTGSAMRKSHQEALNINDLESRWSPSTTTPTTPQTSNSRLQMITDEPLPTNDKRPDLEEVIRAWSDAPNVGKTFMRPQSQSEMSGINKHTDDTIHDIIKEPITPLPTKKSSLQLIATTESISHTSTNSESDAEQNLSDLHNKTNRLQAPQPFETVPASLTTVDRQSLDSSDSPLPENLVLSGPFSNDIEVQQKPSEPIAEVSDSTTFIQTVDNIPTVEETAKVEASDSFSLEKEEQGVGGLLSLQDISSGPQKLQIASSRTTDANDPAPVAKIGRPAAAPTQVREPSDALLRKGSLQSDFLRRRRMFENLSHDPCDTHAKTESEVRGHPHRRIRSQIGISAPRRQSAIEPCSDLQKDTHTSRDSADREVLPATEQSGNFIASLDTKNILQPVEPSTVWSAEADHCHEQFFQSNHYLETPLREEFSEPKTKHDVVSEEVTTSNEVSKFEDRSVDALSAQQEVPPLMGETSPPSRAVDVSVTEVDIRASPIDESGIVELHRPQRESMEVLAPEIVSFQHPGSTDVQKLWSSSQTSDSQHFPGQDQNVPSPDSLNTAMTREDSDPILNPLRSPSSASIHRPKDSSDSNHLHSEIHAKTRDTSAATEQHTGPLLGDEALRKPQAADIQNIAVVKKIPRVDDCDSSFIDEVQDAYADLDAWGRASLNRFAAMLREEARTEMRTDKLNIFNIFAARESRLRTIMYGTEEDLLLARRSKVDFKSQDRPDPSIRTSLSQQNPESLQQETLSDRPGVAKALPPLPPPDACDQTSVISQETLRSGVGRQNSMRGMYPLLQSEKSGMNSTITPMGNGEGRASTLRADSESRLPSNTDLEGSNGDDAAPPLTKRDAAMEAMRVRKLTSPTVLNLNKPVPRQPKEHGEIDNYLKNRRSVYRPFAAQTLGSMENALDFGHEPQSSSTQQRKLPKQATDDFLAHNAEQSLDSAQTASIDHDLITGANPVAGEAASQSAVFDALRDVLPSYDTINLSSGLHELSLIMDMIPEDFGFIHASVVRWDTKIKEQRSVNEALRHARQIESEEHIDSLFDDHEIGYGDIAELESEFKKSEAARKADEDREEYKIFVNDVFDIVWSKLHFELEQLSPQYKQCESMISDSLAGRDLFSETGDGVALSPAMSAFLGLHQKIEIRHQKAFEAVLERDRRLKKTEISPWYSLNNISKVKQLEQQFEAAEKIAIIDYCQQRNERANSLMDVLDENTLRGVGANQDYMESIMKALHDIASNQDALFKFGDGGSSDGLRLIQRAKTIVSGLSNASEQIVQTFHVADMLLNSADYEVSVAKAKVAKADHATLTKLKEERSKEDQKLMRDLEHRLALIRDDTRRTHEEIAKLMLFLGGQNQSAGSASAAQTTSFIDMAIPKVASNRSRNDDEPLDPRP